MDTPPMASMAASSASGAVLCFTFVILNHNTNVSQAHGSINCVNTLRQRLKAARDEAGLTQPELAARAGRVGLWADPDPVPPWEWRRSRR